MGGLSFSGELRAESGEKRLALVTTFTRLPIMAEDKTITALGLH
jgi:hypothetical protein